MPRPSPTPTSSGPAGPAASMSGALRVQLRPPSSSFPISRTASTTTLASDCSNCTGKLMLRTERLAGEELLQLAHSSCRRPRHCLRLPSARTNSGESPLPQPEAASCLHRGRYAHVLLGEENATCCCISSLPRSGTWRVVVQGTLYSLKCHISHELNNLHEGLKLVLHPPLVEE